MSKEKFSILKQKITPKDLLDQKPSYHDRFSMADNVLIPDENIKKSSVVIRKTFSIPEEEVLIFEKIRNRALDYRVVISDSEIIRLGLMQLSKLEDKDFQENILNIDKLPVGRPKS